MASGGTKVSLYGGPRYLNFRDRLNMRFYEDDDDLAGTDNENQSLSIRLDNRMYGGQVGARLEQQLLPSVTLGLQAAFGLYANDVERRRTFVEEAISTTLLNDKISGTKMSWTTDLGATLSWQATSNLSIDLGYSALLLGNVALTPSQFERAATISDSNLRANSDVWVHGVRLGSTLRY